MRPSKKFLDAVVREFKRLFPAVRVINFQIYFVPELLDGQKRKLKGTFNTELMSWSPKFKLGIVELSESSNTGLDDYGCTLVHELLHGYYKKVGGLHKAVEEHLCSASDVRVWEAIKKRLQERTSIFPPLAMAA